MKENKSEKPNCVFCNIVKGNIQTPGIFWEDENFMAFLSTSPSVEGFTVLITKEHYGSDCLAMPDEILEKFILAAKKVSKILLAHFTNSGRIGLVMEGTGIDHAHIKLIPMHDTAHMREGVWKAYHSGKTDYFEKYEGYISSADGPKAETEKLTALAQKLRKAVSC